MTLVVSGWSVMISSKFLHKTRPMNRKMKMIQNITRLKRSSAYHQAGNESDISDLQVLDWSKKSYPFNFAFI